MSSSHAPTASTSPSSTALFPATHFSPDSTPPSGKSPAPKPPRPTKKTPTPSPSTSSTAPPKNHSPSTPTKNPHNYHRFYETPRNPHSHKIWPIRATHHASNHPTLNRTHRGAR